jgi:hypothetical protein
VPDIAFSGALRSRKIEFIEVAFASSMQRYKYNQIQEAIFRTLGARDPDRVNELRLRLKRLLVVDRRLKRGAHSETSLNRHFAFYSQVGPGSGTEIMFSAYEAFALLAAIRMLELGLPQERTIKVLRQVRVHLEAAHTDALKRGLNTVANRNRRTVKQRRPVFSGDYKDAVYLVIVRLSGSLKRPGADTLLAVCRTSEEVTAFMNKHRAPGGGMTFFEFISAIHTLAANLSQTQPVKRGRGAS